jgi:hypothetical protein
VPNLDGRGGKEGFDDVIRSEGGSPKQRVYLGGPPLRTRTGGNCGRERLLGWNLRHSRSRRHDKPGFTWALGSSLLLIWGTILLGGLEGLRTAAPAIGVLGAVMFSVGMVVWIALIPRRREGIRRPDR